MTTNTALLVESDLKVYEVLRRLKKTRVLELARESRLAKSTVQGALSRLQDHGLVSKTVVHGITVIRPRSPSNLLRSLEAQRHHLAERQAMRDKQLLNTIRTLKQGIAAPRRSTARSSIVTRRKK